MVHLDLISQWFRTLLRRGYRHLPCTFINIEANIFKSPPRLSLLQEKNTSRCQIQPTRCSIPLREHLNPPTTWYALTAYWIVSLADYQQVPLEVRLNLHGDPYHWLSPFLEALALYEYLITFADEIETVWKRPWTATSMLLLSTRWVMLLTLVYTVVPSTPTVRPPTFFYSENPPFNSSLGVRPDSLITVQATHISVISCMPTIILASMVYFIACVQTASEWLVANSTVLSTDQ